MHWHAGWAHLTACGMGDLPRRGLYARANWPDKLNQGIAIGQGKLLHPVP